MTGIFKMYPVEGATKEDAVSYVSLLFSLAHVDGLDEQESAAIKQLVAANGWSMEIFDEAQKKSNVSIDSLNLSKEIIEVFGPYLIRDLCAIAHVSNGFSKTEDDMINAVREKIGMSNDSYTKIKAAVSGQLAAISNWSSVISA